MRSSEESVYMSLDCILFVFAQRLRFQLKCNFHRQQDNRLLSFVPYISKCDWKPEVRRPNIHRGYGAENCDYEW